MFAVGVLNQPEAPPQEEHWRLRANAALAEAWHVEGRYSDALAAWDRLVQLGMHRTQAAEKRAGALVGLGRITEAARLLAAAGDAVDPVDLAMCEWHAGRLMAAVAILSSANCDARARNSQELWIGFPR